MRKLYMCLTAFLLAALFASLVPVYAAQRVVRIGLVANTVPETAGEHRLLRGYAMTYLDEIARKTHWHYVYQEVEAKEARRMLRDDELDFIVPVTEHSGAMQSGFIFSDGYPGYGLLSLYTRQDNRALDIDSGLTLEGCRVGMINNESYHTKLEYIMDKNGWNITHQHFENSLEMMDALRSGEIDAVLDDGTHITENERWLMNIDVVVQQFMTVEEKKDLLDALNDAVLDSEILNPNFETCIEGEYLDPVLQNIARYTEAEQAYIAKEPVLRVAVMPYVPPLFDLRTDDKEPWGIYLDLLKVISKDTGIRFEFVEAKDEAAADELLWNGEADMMLSVYDNDRVPEGASFTNTLRTEPFVMVEQADASASHRKWGTIAVPRVFSGLREMVMKRYPGITVEEYPMVRDCLKAVQMGEVSCAFVPSELIHYYSSMASRPDLNVVQTTKIHVPVGIGIAPNQPEILQSVMNTAILRISPAERERIMAKTTEPEVSWRYIIEKYPLRVATGVVVLLLIFGGIVFAVYRARQEEAKNEALREKNRELSEALRRIHSLTEARDFYKQDAETDKLTGLLNKEAFHDEAHNSLGNLSADEFMYLFIMDLDHFKELNDTHGHQCGDEMLVAFAELLKTLFPEAHALGRFGGDEFIGLVSGLTRAELEGCLRDLLEKTRAIRVAGVPTGITVSVGVARAVLGHRRYSELFDKADQALYKVKNQSRDGFVFDEEC